MRNTRQSVIDELMYEYCKPIRDPLWKHIYVSPGIEKLLASREMQDLVNIRQLGPTHLLYPGAVHTRFSHSLGVFHVARQVIMTLIKNSAHLNCSPEGVRAFLAASLLHDLGHFPYTHSLKELPLKDHERLGGEIIGSSSSLCRIISDSIRTDPSMVAAVIDQDLPTDDPEIQMYRCILSGPLDPDKLDYLNRDAYFCGVPYGIQDIDYIISKLCWSDEQNKPGLELSALGALENLIFSKYLMYRYVYWHRTVRSATAMVKSALFSGLWEGAVTPEDLYQVNDHTFHTLCCSTAFQPFSLIDKVREGRLHACRREVPFSRENPEHRKLLDLSYRMRREEQMRGSFPPGSVIIDIPEEISFEVNIPLGKARGTAGPVHVFTPPVVQSMQQGLRIIRVFCDPDIPQDSEGIMELL